MQFLMGLIFFSNGRKPVVFLFPLFLCPSFAWPLFSQMSVALYNFFLIEFAVAIDHFPISCAFLSVRKGNKKSSFSYVKQIITIRYSPSISLYKPGTRRWHLYFSYKSWCRNSHGNTERNARLQPTFYHGHKGRFPDDRWNRKR